jgi:hypothetical protein
MSSSTSSSLSEIPPVQRTMNTIDVDFSKIDMTQAEVITVEQAKELGIPIEQISTTPDGRQWSVWSVPAKVWGAIKSGLQSVGTGCVSTGEACTQCCSETASCCCKGRNKICTVPAMITIGIVTTICGVFIIYGSVCVDEGKHHDPSYSCTHDKHNRKVSSVKHGTYMIVTGVLSCVIGSCAALFGKKSRH